MVYGDKDYPRRKVIYHLDTSKHVVVKHKVNQWRLPGMHQIIDNFLPEGYRTSVRSNYLPYVSWYAVSAVSSSISGVLATQQLLFAVGLGSGAIPLAGALNWVMKDGLGQLGGVVFASVINNRFDADSKRWRMLSAVALDVAYAIEMTSPLVPSHFLLLASVSNIAKNISWISASATRAEMHRNFVLKENLADITAKAASQNTACSVVGTGLGILLSTFIGNQVPLVLSAFSILTTCHLICTYKAMRQVASFTLNTQRLEICTTCFVRGDPVPTPFEMRQLESFVLPFKGSFQPFTIDSGVELTAITRDAVQLETLLRYGDNYVLTVKANRVLIAWSVQATERDQLISYLHACRFASALREGGVLRDCVISSKPSAEMSNAFLSALQDAHWHTDNLLLDFKRCRYDVG